MHKTIHKRVRQPLSHFLAIVVIRLVVDIQHRFLYISYLMPQQIHCNHRNAIPHRIFILLHILRVCILCTKILPETQCFRFKPCLLQFYKYKMNLTVCLAHLSSKIYAKHRDFVPTPIGVFMLSHFCLNNFFFQKCRQQRLNYTFIFHQILEDNIIYGIGYV